MTDAGSKRPLTILVTGPESSGKSTLARALAGTTDGYYVPERARTYLTALDRPYTAADLPRIWQQQAAAEDTARASSAALVFCDTGPFVLAVWAEVKYGVVPHPIADALRTRWYDLVLLCAPDLPWEPDPLREAPDPNVRAALFTRYAELLDEQPAPVAIIRGENRLATALGAVASLRNSRRSYD